MIEREEFSLVAMIDMLCDKDSRNERDAGGLKKPLSGGKQSLPWEQAQSTAHAQTELKDCASLLSGIFNRDAHMIST